jgi:hypothetical protein
VTPPGPGAIEPERRAALLAAKLAVLVESGWGAAGREAVAFPGGAACRDAERAWVLLADEPARALGRALVWAEHHDLALEVLVDDDADLLARRAAAFDRPVAVHLVEGRGTTPARPGPVPTPLAPSAEALALATRFVDAGAEVVVEHGEVLAEVNGLEVARVVTDDGGTRIEVGVGRHDRDAHAMVHGGVPVEEALARAVATVSRHRRPGAPAHPLNRLVPERWMRRWLLDDPAPVGARSLEAVEGPHPRRSLQDTEPAFAVGEDAQGPVVVACSVGVDLELVPAAVDVRDRQAPGARLVLALPERDAVAVTRRLATRLVAPAEVVVPGDGWRAGTAVA